MPIYDYCCVECGCRDERVAGVDDATARCAACGGLMLRLPENSWESYFAKDRGGEHGTEKG